MEYICLKHKAAISETAITPKASIEVSELSLKTKYALNAALNVQDSEVS
jgi:hypothetical protein